MSNTTKHYAKRDPDAQGIHYINHVSAMTTEGLHAKSAIAAELAHRDIEIERLRAALATPAQAAALVSPSGDGFMAAVNEMDGLYAAPAQVATPDMTDAYAGAREDLSIWKKRALEAEALNRKFAASVNSPSFMGEPASPAQAAPVDATMQQDAERYRWLREYAIGAYTSVFRGKSSAAVYLLTKAPALDGIGEETDTAIDAARAAQKGTND